jgi:hypothetical protein
VDVGRGSTSECCGSRGSTLRTGSLGGDLVLGVGLEGVFGGSSAGRELLDVELGSGIVTNENSGCVLDVCKYKFMRRIPMMMNLHPWL